MAKRETTENLDALLRQAHALTRTFGEQTKLAKYIGVTPGRLNEFLKDPPKRRPNGEATLLLQKWVAEQQKNIPKG